MIDLQIMLFSRTGVLNLRAKIMKNSVTVLVFGEIVIDNRGFYEKLRILWQKYVNLKSEISNSVIPCQKIF